MIEIEEIKATPANLKEFIDSLNQNFSWISRSIMQLQERIKALEEKNDA